MSRRGKAEAPHRTGVPEREALPVIGLDEAGSTPILREYRAVKTQHPDAVVLARLGDFYEMFGDDAERAAPVLGVTLTSRGFGGAGRLPMCGVPFHAVTGYIRRLLEAGMRVALWDQVGEVVEGRLVRREVTRVISPGTAVDDAFLDPAVAVRCVALHPQPGRVGLAAVDVSTGEVQLAEVPGGMDSAALAEECERLGAGEIVVADSVEVPAGLAPAAARSRLPPPVFDAGRGAERLRQVTGTASLRGFGVEDLTAAHGAAAALLAVCDRSRLRLPVGFVRLRAREAGGCMRLDAPTRRNLELLAPLGGAGPALVGLLDRTRTPMGARALRTALQEPLLDVEEIDRRLGAVAALVESPSVLRSLREALTPVRDLERLVGRSVQGLAGPRDLGALRDTCRAVPRCRAAVAATAQLEPFAVACEVPASLLERLEHVLVDDPPATAREGGAVRPGADPALDEMLAAGAGARQYISTLEERERERSGIRSLRVGYNRVFGYYLEVPNAHRDLVPADYVRKQTLVGAERYLTAELKEQEAVVLSTRDRAVAREAEVLADVCAAVAACAAPLLAAAGALGALDMLQSLAEAAVEQRWTRPVIDTSTDLEIEDGRHPVVEASLPAGTFVPNDCALDAASPIVVLTGPNMAGKSTWLRQVALIALLAQVGSFVPARRARIGLCDRIFTRVGAQDDLAAGLSTFMVEMTETAAILNAATPRSLVVLDEIGRGTSTYDGLSIAQAVVEHIHDAPQLRCRTLFATHYHELTALAARLPGVRNARVEVVETGDTVTFLHRIVEGGADRSYGIHVARLAGIPAGVVGRARTILAELEAQRPLGPRPDDGAQLALPLVAEAHPMVDELGRLDLDGLTPLMALNKLAEWRERLAAGEGTR